MITKQQFAGFSGISRAEIFYPIFVSELTSAGLMTKLRACAFMAEAFHESGDLSALVENLNYSAKGLMDTFGTHYFPSLEIASHYAHKPQEIANHVYGGRMGNNTDNDGWMYRGRGIFQNTGKDSYIKLSYVLGVDFVTHPELLEKPENAVKAAIWYWNSNHLSQYADLGEIEKVSKAINRGNANSKFLAINNDERNSKYNELIKIWK